MTAGKSYTQEWHRVFLHEPWNWWRVMTHANHKRGLEWWAIISGISEALGLERLSEPENSCCRGRNCTIYLIQCLCRTGVARKKSKSVAKRRSLIVLLLLIWALINIDHWLGARCCAEPWPRRQRIAKANLSILCRLKIYIGHLCPQQD